MQRYDIEEELGTGTYGTVFRARSKTGEAVAIKRLKKGFQSWKECISLRELESLESLRTHENIVSIKELIREDDSQLFFVFEYMPDGTLYQLMKECALLRLNGANTCNSTNVRFLDSARIRSFVSQILHGLDHMHQQGFCHRDIKPENLLLRGDQIKIADFGLARQSRALDPSLTEYISTRWYRSPEILLRDPLYGTRVDIFALGCVMGEMCSLKPLFPGANEIDQVSRIFACLGFPSQFNWPNGIELARKLGLSSLGPVAATNVPLFGESPELATQRARMSLSYAIPNACSLSICMLSKMLTLDPQDRPSARDILKDPFFGLAPVSVPQMGLGIKNMQKMLLQTPHIQIPKENSGNLVHYSVSPRTSAI